MLQQQEMTPKQKFLAGLSRFLLSYRTILLAILGLVIALIIAFAIGTEVRASNIEKSTAKIEEAEEKLSEFLNAGDEEDTSSLEAELFAELSDIIDRHPRHFAGLRALFLRGSLQYYQESYKEAYDDFIALSSGYPDSYLAPISLVYAAISMEEHDQAERAVEAYGQLIEEYPASMEVPRTLFALGRLAENENDIEGAKGYYNQLIDDHSSSNWTKLARNRIIWLDSE